MEQDSELKEVKTAAHVSKSRDDFFDCMRQGRIFAAGVFIATLGTSYLAQYVFMNYTKRFFRRKQQISFPLGAAVAASFLASLYKSIQCKNNWKKRNDQFYGVPQKSVTSVQATEFDEMT